MEAVRIHAPTGAAVAVALVFSVMAGSVHGAGTTPDITGTYLGDALLRQAPDRGRRRSALTAMGKEAYAKTKPA
jgi:hypothetical protein